MKNPSQSGVTIHYDVELGWICETPIVLTRPQLAAVVAFTQKAQRDRIKNWPMGDRKYQASRALDLLTPANIQQRVTPARRDEDIMLVGGN